MACTPTGSSPMKGGRGRDSYAQNSSFQRKGVESAKVLISEAIAEKLDIKLIISSSNLFTIADLGCSTGPNTIIAVENIIESVKLKYQSFGPNQEAPEFQVYLNDHFSNDFNTLFKSLPSDKQYFAAGIPGLFQGRLFPKASLHFVHSSYALHWLSKVPKELMDKNLPAWNKGRIYHTTAPDEVCEAYLAQFSKDLDGFLNVRAQELVEGGLMALILPCQPDGISSDCFDFAFIGILEACLNEMANVGLLTEDKVDSFNYPQYNPTRRELEALIERNSYFNIERMKALVNLSKNRIVPDVQGVIFFLRATWEELIRSHFGDDIIDELFDRLKKKIVDSALLSQSSGKRMLELYVLLKSKIY